MDMRVLNIFCVRERALYYYLILRGLFVCVLNIFCVRERALYYYLILRGLFVVILITTNYEFTGVILDSTIVLKGSHIEVYSRIEFPKHDFQFNYDTKCSVYVAMCTIQDSHITCFNDCIAE